MNPKSTARKADSVAKKDRRQKWSAASSFLSSSMRHSTVARVVIAPDFQRGVAPIGDKNPKDIAGQIKELAADGRFVGLDFFAHDDKAPLGLPVTKFKIECSDAVDLIDGLPLGDLIEPALEVIGISRATPEFPFSVLAVAIS